MHYRLRSRTVHRPVGTLVRQLLFVSAITIAGLAQASSAPLVVVVGGFNTCGYDRDGNVTLDAGDIGRASRLLQNELHRRNLPPLAWVRGCYTLVGKASWKDPFGTGRLFSPIAFCFDRPGDTAAPH